MPASVEQQDSPLASDGAWLLLAELNHRVGNELQAALAALRLAKRGVGESAAPLRFLEEAVARLEGFGDVHQILDRQRGHAPLAQRLERLCRATATSKAGARGIHIRLNVEDIQVDDEAAWTICVVASELMTNAFKHAFPGGLPGVIGVSLRQDGEGVLLTVSDNGVGAPARLGETVWQAPGFGCGIVAQLAERLGGFVTRAASPNGTVVTFRVPGARRMQ